MGCKCSENGDFQADALAGLKTAVAAAKEAADKAGDITADDNTPTTPAASAEEKFAKDYAEKYATIKPFIDAFKAAKDAYTAADLASTKAAGDKLLEASQNLQTVLVHAGTGMGANADFIAAVNAMAPELYSFKVGKYTFAVEGASKFIEVNSNDVKDATSNFVKFDTATEGKATLDLKTVIAANGAKLELSTAKSLDILSPLSFTQISEADITKAIDELTSYTQTLETPEYKITNELASGNSTLKIYKAKADGSYEATDAVSGQLNSTKVDLGDAALVAKISSPSALLNYLTANSGTTIQLASTDVTIDGAKYTINALNNKTLDVSGFGDMTLDLTKYALTSGQTITSGWAEPGANNHIVLDAANKYTVKIDVSSASLGTAGATDVLGNTVWEAIDIKNFNTDDKLEIKMASDMAKVLSTADIDFANLTDVKVKSDAGAYSAVKYGIKDGAVVFKDAKDVEYKDLKALAAANPEIQWDDGKNAADVIAEITTNLSNATANVTSGDVFKLSWGDDLYLIAVGLTGSDQTSDELILKLNGMADANVSIATADTITISYDAQA